MDASLPFPARRRFGILLICLFVLAATLWVMTRAWNATLLDRYQFRQTQTALSVYWMRQEGFSLAYATPLFGPPWSIPMEFPLYQWLVAQVSKATGWGIEPMGRLVGVAFFLACLPAFHGLARMADEDGYRRLLIGAAVLATPVCLFYARTLMIESCAATLAVWYLYAHVRATTGGSRIWVLAAIAAAILAALVKITSFLVFAVPACIHMLVLLRQVRGQPAFGRFGEAARLLTYSALPVVLALACTLAWVRFSDGIKAANPFGTMLTSADLEAWNYGTLAQRLSPEFWQRIGYHFTHGIMPLPTLLALLAAAFAAPARHRLAALACLAGYAAGPLVFANLYAVHEYYEFPAALLAAAAAGLILAGLAASPRVPGWAVLAVIVAYFTGQALTFNSDYATTLRHPPAPPPSLVQVVREATQPEEVVLVYGWDWNSLIPYYAERRAILVPEGRENDVEKLEAVLASLGSRRVTALVVAGRSQTQAGFIHWRTSRLGLTASPVARSQQGDVYVRPETVPALEAHYRGVRLHGLEFDFTPKTEASSAGPAQPIQASDFAGVANTPPEAVYTPWRPTPFVSEGHPRVMANAPSELHFRMPAGTKAVTISYGLLEKSYTPPNHTDGVDVLVYELLPAGSRRTLFRRYLNPAQQPTDRGVQTATLPIVGASHGTVVFAFLPGPADDSAYDWSFWQKIDFH